MATGKINTTKLKYGTLGTSNISTSTGTIDSGSEVRYCYNNDWIAITYMIRVKNPNGRPTVTVSGLPDVGYGFTRQGNPSQVRIGTTNEISDLNYIEAGGTSATIRMFNYIGNAPSGNGYIVISGSFTAPIA